MIDGRPTGNWKLTPWWLRIFGKPRFYRNIYAHGAIGGGWDGWEFSNTVKEAA